MPLSDEQDFLRVCYYGNPGSGKTTAVASGARLGRVLALLSENGMHRKPLEDLGIPTALIEPVRKVDFDSMRESIYKIRTDLYDEPGSWSAIVLDSATELTRVWLESIVDGKYQEVERTAAARGESPDPKNRFFVSRDYYGQTTQQWQRILRDVADLPCHVAFTAHVRRDVDEDDGMVRYGPDLPPAMQANLMGHVGVLIHTKEAGAFADGRTVLVGYTHNSGKFVTKDRLNSLPRVLAFPTLDRVIGYVEGDLTEDNDPVQQELLDWDKARKAKDNKE